MFFASRSRAVTARSWRGRPRGRIQSPVHALRLLVEPHARQPLLAADAALLETAERGGDGKLLVRVDPYRARLQRARQPPRPLIVCGPHPGGQAIDGIVR